MLDSQFTEGFLREIPVVKTIWAVYKSGKSIRDNWYLRKLETFLKNIEGVNEDDCQKFLRDAEADEKSFSGSLLLILDKIEDERKAILIAKAFKVCIIERFSLETFNRILLIINRGFCDDLLKIQAFEGNDELTLNNKYIEPESLEELLSCGLLTNAGFDGGNFGSDYGGTIYPLNKYGEIFLRIIKEMN